MVIEKKILKSPRRCYIMRFFHAELTDSSTDEGPGAGARCRQESQMEYIVTVLLTVPFFISFM
jgi:hypothetical protein